MSHTNGAQRAGLAALMSPLAAALQHALQQQQQHAFANGGPATIGPGAGGKENTPPAQGGDVAAALPIVERMSVLFRCGAARWPADAAVQTCNQSTQLSWLSMALVPHMLPRVGEQRVGDQSFCMHPPEGA